jgi:hypothetical protein
MNQYNIGYGWWVVFIIGSIVSLAVGVAAGLRAAWNSREKRDGKR